LGDGGVADGAESGVKLADGSEVFGTKQGHELVRLRKRIGAGEASRADGSDENDSMGAAVV
jgi:hypothetical protein